MGVCCNHNDQTKSVPMPSLSFVTLYSYSIEKHLQFLQEKTNYFENKNAMAPDVLLKIMLS